ncbi:hypothetical protein BB559_002183 [Furculomyces boomerangus]|uniref:Uncharacterized protein n=1 Tax=Furculomyces boomerangus TaxID=61424 RepID=A0A2T9YXA9_9FUNG|nr:hypothetical protein BB559_002183 [Furculomyces boomerangus]
MLTSLPKPPESDPYDNNPHKAEFKTQQSPNSFNKSTESFELQFSKGSSSNTNLEKPYSILSSNTHCNTNQPSNSITYNQAVYSQQKVLSTNPTLLKKSHSQLNSRNTPKTQSLIYNNYSSQLTPKPLQSAQNPQPRLHPSYSTNFETKNTKSFQTTSSPKGFENNYTQKSDINNSILNTNDYFLKYSETNRHISKNPDSKDFNISRNTQYITNTNANRISAIPSLIQNRNSNTHKAYSTISDFDKDDTFSPPQLGKDLNYSSLNPNTQLTQIKKKYSPSSSFERQNNNSQNIHSQNFDHNRSYTLDLDSLSTKSTKKTQKDPIFSMNRLSKPPSRKNSVSSTSNNHIKSTLISNKHQNAEKTYRKRVSSACTEPAFMYSGSPQLNFNKTPNNTKSVISDYEPLNSILTYKQLQHPKNTLKFPNTSLTKSTHSKSRVEDNLTNSRKVPSETNSESDDFSENKMPKDIKSQSAKIQQLLKEKFDLQVRNKTLMDSLNQLSFEGLDALVNDFSRARASNIKANERINQLKDNVLELRKRIKVLERSNKAVSVCNLEHRSNEKEMVLIKSLKMQIETLENELMEAVNENKHFIETVAELRSECDQQYRISEQLRMDALREREKSDMWQSLAQNPQVLQHSNQNTKVFNSDLGLNGQTKFNRLRTGTATTTTTNETLLNNLDNGDILYTNNNNNLFRIAERHKNDTGNSQNEYSNIKALEKHCVNLESELDKQEKNYSSEINHLKERLKTCENENKLVVQNNIELERSSKLMRIEINKLNTQLSGLAFSNFVGVGDGLSNDEINFLEAKTKNLEGELKQKNFTIIRLNNILNNLRLSTEETKKICTNNLHKATIDPLVEHKVKSLLSNIQPVSSIDSNEDDCSFYSPDQTSPPPF